ncbi:MAG: 5-formyltetrahydrofolate cyclo-ligase, partial [Clostridium baratii]|nr:5-formyltetrahydrofolate cyclo-ligase [Clostridium baratii]
DKFLSSNKIDTKKIALAYDFQVLDKVPSEKHDIKIDSIITEDNEIDISNK